MLEMSDMRVLEPFRHPLYPFLYEIDDAMAVHDVLHSIQKPYGLEIGFGKEPTSVFTIDSTLPWILTEPDSFRFTSFKKDTRNHWLDIKSSLVSIEQPIIAVNTYATDEMQKEADVLVYRNVDYKNMTVVPFDELHVGQRTVFIVDGDHIPEVPLYGHFLQENGYNPKRFARRSQEEIQFTYPYPFSPYDYVLDTTR